MLGQLGDDEDDQDDEDHEHEDALNAEIAHGCWTGTVGAGGVATVAA